MIRGHSGIEIFAAERKVSFSALIKAMTESLFSLGFLLGIISSNQLLAQLGIFIGRGALLSLAIVLFVLPGLLYLLDRFVMNEKRTKGK